MSTFVESLRAFAPTGSRLTVKGAWSFLLKGTAAGLGFLAGVLLARLLGPRDYGTYSIAMAYVGLAVTTCEFGLPVLLTREVATRASAQQLASVRQLLRSGTRVAYTIASALLIGVAAILVTGRHLSALPLFGAATPIAALIVVGATNSLRAATLRGLGHVLLADIPDLLLRPSIVLMLTATAAVTQAELSPTSALTMQATGAFSALLLGSWLLGKSMPAGTHDPGAPRESNAWLAAAPALFVIAILSTVEGQLPLYMCGFVGSAREAALYNSANQLVGITIIGLVAVNVPLQPRLAAAWAREDHQLAQKLVREASRMGFLVAMASAILLMPFASVILRIYGEDYVAAAGALRFLVLAQLVNAACGPCGLVLAMTGHQSAALVGLVAAIFVNAVAGYCLIPLFGATGAAVAAMISLATWNVILTTLSWYRTRLNTTPFSWSLGTVQADSK